MDAISIYVIVSSVVGFAFSTYVFRETKRKTLEHKSMIVLDLIFAVSFAYGIFSLLMGIDVVLPKGLVLAILAPLNLYVGIIAVHHRNVRIDRIARACRKKEELKMSDGHVRDY